MHDVYNLILAAVDATFSVGIVKLVGTLKISGHICNTVGKNIKNKKSRTCHFFGFMGVSYGTRKEPDTVRSLSAGQRAQWMKI